MKDGKSLQSHLTLGSVVNLVARLATTRADRIACRLKIKNGLAELVLETTELIAGVTKSEKIFGGIGDGM